MSNVIDGRPVTYELAERSVEVQPGFRMREVRRRRANGHQTAIVTTRTDQPIAVLAYRMFEQKRKNERAVPDRRSGSLVLAEMKRPL